MNDLGVSFEIKSHLSPDDFAAFIKAVLPKARGLCLIDETGVIVYDDGEEQETMTNEELTALYEKGNGESAHG